MNIYRENYYLGDLINISIPLNKENWITLEDLLKINSTAGAYYIYENQLIQAVKKTNYKNKKFKWSKGDITHPVDEFTIVKNRAIDLNKGVIIRSLGIDRHWLKNYYYNKPNDIPFEQKKSKIFWRGSTTGEQSAPGGNRFDLISKWYDKNKDIDVCFSESCQEGLHWGKFFQENNYLQYIKEFCEPSVFLEHKYLLSVRGNDKDSGLNWKLNSNSLVLMPKPTVCSWLMESLLMPNVHYIEIKSDFSDLEEKLEWCNSNQEICKKIIYNANKFMETFKDFEKEDELETNVINRYFELTNNIYV